MSSETIDYYNRYAVEYARETTNVDMAALYAEFLPMVTPGGHILDAGCGSGRDAAYFKQLGFTVSAFDASAELATIASQRLKQPVTVQQFEQLDQHEQYDGIWCCASLLHVAPEELPGVLSRLWAALALIAMALGGLGLSLPVAMVLAVTAYTTGPMMGALAAWVPRRWDLAGERFVTTAALDLLRALAGGLWQLALLPQHARHALDAVLRTDAQFCLLEPLSRGGMRQSVKRFRSWLLNQLPDACDTP